MLVRPGAKSISRRHLQVYPKRHNTDAAKASAGDGNSASRSKSPAKHPAGSSADRRKRWRVRIEEKVHIRGGIGTLEMFEDVAQSIDVTRDGLLILTSRGGYWVGQILHVTFPYRPVPGAINVARRAKVVRNQSQPPFRYTVAVQFEQGEAAGAGLLATPTTGHVRVLGVESDPGAARAIRDLLEQDGYQVVMVPSAQDALDILQSHTPDVVFAQAEGGRVSGRDLCTTLKKTLRLQHIPVILMTNSALPSDYSASHRAGAVMCIRTPCDPGRVQRAIHLVVPPPAHRSPYSGSFNMSSFTRTS